MLLRHTLLYLPAQFVGPLFQLVAMIVWTHVVDEHTLGIITLVTATHELLQIGFLAWWSQYSLRFFGRYQDGEKHALLPHREYGPADIHRAAEHRHDRHPAAGYRARRQGRHSGRTVGYVITRSLNLYIGERARVPPPDLGLFDPADFRAVGGFRRRPGVDQAARSIRRMAAGGLCGRTTGRRAHCSA